MSFKARSYWDSFVDADIPLWHRALDGAFLPVALAATVVGSLVGCSDERREAPSCGDAEANGLHVQFKSGYVGDEEKQIISHWLEHDEAALRRLSPGLFCNFNGWEVTDELKGAQAYYDGRLRKVFVPRNLTASSHEFCHYLSHHSSFQGGKRASETDEWAELSCFLTGRYQNEIAGCVDHTSNLLRGAEEEFANTCAPAFVSPLGALLTYASEPKTLEQIRFVLQVMQIPAWRVEVLTQNVLRPPVTIDLQAQIESSRLPIPQALQNPNILKAGEGMFGYLLDPHNFRFFLPSHTFEGWDLRNVKAPSAFQGDPPNAVPFSIAFHQENYTLQQDGVLYSLSLKDIGTRNPATEDLWTREDIGEALKGPGHLAFLDDRPAFFKQAGYWIQNSSGTSSVQNYPQEIQQALASSESWRIQEAEGQLYLWIGGLPSDSGRESRLYRVEENNGVLGFQKVFEIPSTVTGSPPHYYRGNWYLIERVTNAEPTSMVPEFVSHYVQLSPPILLKIEEGGRKITPMKIHYPEQDRLALFIAMSSVNQGSWVVSGLRIVGLARNQWEAADESLVLSPAFLSFDWAP